MAFQVARPYISRFALGFALGLPVAVTFVENVGSLKGVHGISMQPTLNPKPHFRGDVVLVNSWAVRQFEGINRGDIVTLMLNFFYNVGCMANGQYKLKTCDPSDPDAVLIKRVIGVAGDHVKTISYKKKIVHIPAGHCWVEGDNHSHSHDSNAFGPVSLGLIQGKATHIVWPPRRWQRLENSTTEGRLSFERNSTPNESRNTRDSLNNPETTTKRDGITCNNSSRSHSVIEDTSSVSELIYGPMS